VENSNVFPNMSMFFNNPIINKLFIFIKFILLMYFICVLEIFLLEYFLCIINIKFF
jgi:hypothetical protein